MSKLSQIKVNPGNDTASNAREEIDLDIKAEGLDLQTGLDGGMVLIDGPTDDLRQLVANEAFIERFFGDMTPDEVLALVKPIR